MRKLAIFEGDELIRLLKNEAEADDLKFKPGAKLGLFRRRYIPGRHDEPGQLVEEPVDELILRDVRED